MEEEVKDLLDYVPQVFGTRLDQSIMEAHPELGKQGCVIGKPYIVRVVIQEDIDAYGMNPMHLNEWLLNDKFQAPETDLEDGQSFKIILIARETGDIEAVVSARKNQSFPKLTELIGALEIGKNSVIERANSSSSKSSDLQPYVLDEKDIEFMGLLAESKGLKVGDTLQLPQDQIKVLKEAKEQAVDLIDNPPLTQA